MLSGVTAQFGTGDWLGAGLWRLPARPGGRRGMYRDTGESPLMATDLIRHLRKQPTDVSTPVCGVAGAKFSRTLPTRQFQLAGNRREPGGAGLICSRASWEPGKTTLTKGNHLSGQGAAQEEEITSPTFTLIHKYTDGAKSAKRPAVYHIDLYRIESRPDLETLGLDDIFNERAIVIVEWPERLILPTNWPVVRIKLEHAWRKTCGRLRFAKTKAARSGHEIIRAHAARLWPGAGRLQTHDVKARVHVRARCRLPRPRSLPKVAESPRRCQYCSAERMFLQSRTFEKSLMPRAEMVLMGPAKMAFTQTPGRQVRRQTDPFSRGRPWPRPSR